MGQVHGVSANPESGRRWGGFVCPDCRFVFRVPREHDGRGLVCPSCRRLLRIPAAGEPTPALIEERPEAPQADEAEEGESGTQRGRTVRKRRDESRRSGSGPSWDRDGRSPRRSSNRREGRSMRWILIGGGLAFLLLVGGVILALRGGGSDDTIVSGTAGTPRVPPPIATGGGPKAGGTGALARPESEILGEAGPLARSFLEAQTVSEMAKVVRNPDVAAARMKEWYPDGKLEPQGLAAFNPTGVVDHGKSAATIDVRLADQSTRGMSFVPTPDGLRIDWESWVGWSEVPWTVFLQDRPTQPKIFRVIVKAVDYYNFGFTDDRKWRSLRLEPLDGETAMYGYVERDTPLDKKIQVDPDAKQSPMILRLKFPDGAPAGSNQVLITDWVADGWVEPNTPSP